MYKTGKQARIATDLMAFALQATNELTEQTTYGKPSKMDQEIIALGAQLDKANKFNGKLTKQLKQLPKKAIEAGSGNGKNTKRDMPTWAPPSGDDTHGPRTYKGAKDWYWCPQHKAWGKHQIKDYKAHKDKFDAEESVKPKAESKDTDEDPTVTAAAAFYQALEAIQADE